MSGAKSRTGSTGIDGFEAGTGAASAIVSGPSRSRCAAAKPPASPEQREHQRRPERPHPHAGNRNGSPPRSADPSLVLCTRSGRRPVACSTRGYADPSLLHLGPAVSVPTVTSHLIRNARLVPLAPGEEAPDRPLDVLVERGTVTAVGPGLARPDGVEESDAEGRWLIPGTVGPARAPGPVDARLAAPRPRRRPVAGGRDPGRRRADRRVARTTRSSAGATAPAAGTATSPSPSSTPSPATPRSC